MCSDVVIAATRLGKTFRVFTKPSQQLGALLLPRRGGGSELAALRDVTFTVEQGESVAIIGRNGSGKSTLLNVVCGILTPTHGTVTTRGRIVGMLELGTGFDPDFSGRENARLTAAIFGLGEEEIAARLEHMTEFADIGDAIERPVREYSSGMVARLAFAVCAHVDADILVVDEILAVGDAAFQQKCMRFLRTFKAKGGTLLFVSHGEHAVLSLCRRALWLHQGKVLADGPSKEVYHAYAASIEEHEGMLSAPAVALGHGPAPVRAPASSPFQPFRYDPDARGPPFSGTTITQIDLCDENGDRRVVLEGGEEIDVSVRCAFEEPVSSPVVAFLVRNKLGRIVFADDTAQLGSAAASAGAFLARFTLPLPYLPSGDYLVEAFVFDNRAPSPQLLARSIDRCFFQIQSRHPGGGLANIAPRRIAIGPAEPGTMAP